jgi:hypothetical protein
MEERVERRIADRHAQLHITSPKTSNGSSSPRLMRGNARNMDQIFKKRAQNFLSLNAFEIASLAEFAWSGLE